MYNDEENIDILARTIYGEDRGGGKTGMSAVASVIENRCQKAIAYMLTHGHAHPLFGDGSEASACKIAWQFSCWNKNDPNCEVITNVTTADSSFADAMEIAASAINGDLPDSTSGATYYFSAYLKEWPNWAKGKTPCAKIENQLYFNDI